MLGWQESILKIHILMCLTILLQLPVSKYKVVTRCIVATLCQGCDNLVISVWVAISMMAVPLKIRVKLTHLLHPLLQDPCHIPWPRSRSSGRETHQ